MTKYYGREILNGEVGIQTVTESYLLVTLKIKLIKLGHSISMDKLQRRPELLFSMVVFFMSLLELTLNPSRKIMFSCWWFLEEKLSICLLPLSILYLCRRKMIWETKRNELHIKYILYLDPALSIDKKVFIYSAPMIYW